MLRCEFRWCRVADIAPLPLRPAVPSGTRHHLTRHPDSLLGECIMFRSLRSCPPPKIGDGLLRECKDTVAKLTQQLSAELFDLSNQQAKALADAVFIAMTAVETLEYDNRQARLCRFCEEMGWCGVDVLRIA